MLHWGRSVVEHLLCFCKALGSIPLHKKRGEKKLVQWKLITLIASPVKQL